MKKIINVVGAIILKDNKVLCAQRSEFMSLPLYWEFPGGKIDKGETPEMALKRELIEEMKCHINIESFFISTSYEYEFGIVNLHTFLCTLNDSDPVLLEHKSIKWLMFDELEDLNWAPADIPVVKKLKSEFYNIKNSY